MSMKMNTMNLSQKNLKVASLFFVGAGLAFFISQHFSLFPDLTSSETIAPDHLAAVSLVDQKNTRDHLLKDLSLQARAAIVLELENNNVLFEKNADEILPLASISKLMTAFVARMYAPENGIVTITSEDLSTEGDSGLRPGERWQLGELIDAMLIASSNDAAHAVASFVGTRAQEGAVEGALLPGDEYFSRLMNDTARLLGFTHTQFFNETGLDVTPTQSGGYGSAREVAKLLEKLYAMFPRTLEVTSRTYAKVKSVDGGIYGFQNTNEAIRHLPGLMGSKTGYTDLAGGNLAILFDRGIGSRFIVVVLGSTHEGRFSDMQMIVDAIRKEQ